MPDTIPPSNEEAGHPALTNAVDARPRAQRGPRGNDIGLIHEDGRKVDPAANRGEGDVSRPAVELPGASRGEVSGAIQAQDAAVGGVPQSGRRNADDPA